MMVSEADRIKAVERVKVAIAPNLGDSPSFPRKRSIYRALKRGDPLITVKYNMEVGNIRMMARMAQMFYGQVRRAIFEESPFLIGLKEQLKDD